MLFRSRAEKLDGAGRIILIFMIFPVIRIAELFLSFSLFWNVLAVYLILLFLSSFYMFKLKIDPGFTKKKLSWIPFVIFISAGVGYLGSLFFEFGKYSELIVLIPLIVYTEEVLFRGLIQNSVQEKYGINKAILFTTILYAIFSLSLGIPLMLFMVSVSIIMSLIYAHTKNIFLTIIMSLIVHVFLFAL